MQTLECLAVASFVAGHLVDRVVDGIEVGSLGTLGKVDLASGGAVLGLDAELEVLLGGGGHNLAEKLGELGGMLGLLMGGLLVVEADLGIALTEGDARHREVHADLGALAVEVGAEVLDDVLGDALSLADADDMLGSPGELALLLGEAGAGALALRADVVGGELVSVVLLDVTAHGADKLHSCFLSLGK